MNFESPLVTELTADSQRQPSAPNPWTPYGKHDKLMGTQTIILFCDFNLINIFQET